MYFHYLPFCDVFASHDKTQSRYAKVWMKPTQALIDRDGVRRDLEEVQELEATSGEVSWWFPPRESTGVFARTLDRLRPGWRTWEDGPPAVEQPKDPDESETPEKWIRMLDEARARGTKVAARHTSKGESGPSGA